MRAQVGFRKYRGVVVFAAGLAAAGLFLLLKSLAATPTAVIDPTTATSPARVVVDPTASGGLAVQFGTKTSSAFVQVCGTLLCLNGQSWRIHGATAYGEYSNATNEATLAVQAKVNVLELVEYENNYHNLSDTMSEATWAKVDQFIATAAQHNIHVILNFSSYGQSLMVAGIKPTTYDWNNFLSFVTQRVNTISHIKYADDPTIAMMELYGEIDAPNYNVPLRGTTAETTNFFKRTLAQLRALDPNHVISSGGFSYLNDSGSGIDWRAIMSDPNNQTCDVEINSYPDRNISVPNVSSYCAGLGKPWFLAAWSSCYQNKGFDNDINSYLSDADMAAHAQDMYNVARNNHPTAPGPAMAAVGSDFWNLANRPIRLGICDIGTQFPQTLGVVQANAP